MPRFLLGDVIYSSTFLVIRLRIFYQFADIRPAERGNQRSFRGVWPSNSVKEARVCSPIVAATTIRFEKERTSAKKARRS
jgi:hypothetical protein